MIAIIGSNGQLGWELVRRAERRKWEASALDFPEMGKDEGHILNLKYLAGNM